MGNIRMCKRCKEPMSLHFGLYGYYYRCNHCDYEEIVGVNI